MSRIVTAATWSVEKRLSPALAYADLLRMVREGRATMTPVRAAKWHRRVRTRFCVR